MSQARQYCAAQHEGKKSYYIVGTTKKRILGTWLLRQKILSSYSRLTYCLIPRHDMGLHLISACVVRIQKGQHRRRFEWRGPRVNPNQQWKLYSSPIMILLSLPI